MTYQRVYVLDDLLEDDKGRTFLSKEVMKKLSQRGQEYNLVYFTRRNGYTVIDDFPVKGEELELLTRSTLEGPLEEEPEEDDQDLYSPAVEAFFRCIPADEMPDEFVPIEYREYSIRSDEDFQRHLQRFYLNSINRELIKKVGREALQTLEYRRLTVHREEREPQWYVYSEFFDETVLSFEYSETGPYPLAELKMFGAKDTTLPVLKKLGLSRLLSAFTCSASKRLGVHDSLQQGFSYDLPLDEVNIERMDEEERIIL